MWLKRQVSLYTSHRDNTGRPATYRDILHADFFRDLEAIIALRDLDKADPNYKQMKMELKSTLQCYTPAALLACKAKGKVSEIHRTGVMQLDFDHADIKEYDLEDLKQCVFSLPFIGFCGLSCSGDGFYALALIEEPERLSDYAEHCFDVLLEHGIKADTSKGKKVENLRYLSYDSKMLIRENPVPLRIKRFKAKSKPQKPLHNTKYRTVIDADNAVINRQLRLINEAYVGNRWPTVQKAAYTLGGLGDKGLLNKIKLCIKSNSAFSGEEDKYIKCAELCFEEGLKKPISCIA